MKKNIFLASLALALFFSSNCTFASHNIENLSAKEAIQKLKQGNKRFISNKARFKNQS